MASYSISAALFSAALFALLMALMVVQPELVRELLTGLPVTDVIIRSAGVLGLLGVVLRGRLRVRLHLVL